MQVPFRISYLIIRMISCLKIAGREFFCARAKKYYLKEWFQEMLQAIDSTHTEIPV